MAQTEFLAGLRRHGSSPALVARDGTVVSYAQLADRVDALAVRMAAPRGLVAVQGAACVEAVVGLLSAFRAGHAALLLPSCDEPAAADLRDRFRPDAEYRRQHGGWRLTTNAGAGATPPHPDLALLLATSGSTGRPRLVRLSTKAVYANASAIGAYLGLAADDRAALVLPLAYSYGLSVLTSHLAAGASVWLHGGSILDADFLPGLATQGCSNLAGVPYSFDLLERIGFRDADVPHLRFMTVAGGRLDPDRIRLYDAHLRTRGGRFFAMYGQTEATARIAHLPPDRAAAKPDSIGVAIPGGTLALAAADGTLIDATGVAGELVYRGPNVMMGYADTRADLARGAEVEALATGDLAERDPDGLYRIIGRLKRITKIAGVRIALDGLEAQLAAEGITAAVVGDDEMLVAACEGTLPADRVQARLAALAALPGTRVRAVAVARLPRLASGKPDLAAVRALPPRPAADPGIEAAFRTVFLPRPVAPDDSFESLGGDSLRRVELALMLEDRLGRLPEGWEAMPVAAFARLDKGASVRSARIDTDVLLRVLAILAVVTHHATDWPIPVGSALMVLLLGYGLARFQVRALATDGLAGFLAPLPLVLAPYFLIVAGYALAWGQVPWASVFLAGNLGLGDPANHTMLPYLYWFVEVYVQLLLVLSGVFLFPAARRAAIGTPFAFALAFLAAAVALRMVVPPFWDLGGRQIFTPVWVAPLAAFGWCVAVARGRQVALVLALAAIVMPVLAWDGGNWVGAWVRYGGVFVAIGLLAVVPSLPVPVPALPALLTLAAASYPIYLLHRLVPEAILAPLETLLPAPAFVAASIAGGIALGLLAARAWRRVTLHARSEAIPRLRRITGPRADFMNRGGSKT